MKLGTVVQEEISFFKKTFTHEGRMDKLWTKTEAQVSLNVI